MQRHFNRTRFRSCGCRCSKSGDTVNPKTEPPPLLSPRAAVSQNMRPVSRFIRRKLRQSPALLCLLGVAVAASGCATILKSNATLPAVAEPTRVEPVTAAMGFDPPRVRAGETLEVLVRVCIAGGFHIYGTGSVAGPFAPTTLKLNLPRELQPAGDWIVPRPNFTSSGESGYTDSVLFRRRVKVKLNALEQLLSIKGEFSFQACDEESCRPPAKIALSASLPVVSR